MKLMKAIALVQLILFTGCATIVSSKTQQIPVQTTPVGAAISVTDETNAVVYNGLTPATVVLPRAAGYFKPKAYKLTLSKPGYTPVSINLNSRLNGWYVGGNLLFGGLIGWLIVDPLTGAMYTLEPKDINQTLVGQAALKGQENNGISIVMLEDIPVALRSTMKAVTQ